MENSTEGKRQDLNAQRLANQILAIGRSQLNGGNLSLVHVHSRDPSGAEYAVQVTNTSTLDDIRQQLSRIPE